MYSKDFFVNTVDLSENTVKFGILNQISKAVKKMEKNSFIMIKNNQINRSMDNDKKDL